MNWIPPGIVELNNLLTNLAELVSDRARVLAAFRDRTGTTEDDLRMFLATEAQWFEEATALVVAARDRTRAPLS